MQLDDDAPRVSVMALDNALGANSLSDLLGGLIDTGVVLQADLVLTLADVDLVYIGLRAVISAVDAEPAQAALATNAIVSAEART
ncbi:MAG: gas vesicle protein [Pseudomonadota bacterium]